MSQSQICGQITSSVKPTIQRNLIYYHKKIWKPANVPIGEAKNTNNSFWHFIPNVHSKLWKF